MIDEKKLIEHIKALETAYQRFWEKFDSEDDFWDMNACGSIIAYIEDMQKVGEWIPCSERLPENAKHRGAFCPKYHVKTKYGITQGWYNPDTESWYCLFWFLVGRYDETDIDFEKGDKPKVVRILDGTGEVLAWKEPSELWEEEK